jgi:hypothetical protein
VIAERPEFVWWPLTHAQSTNVNGSPSPPLAHCDGQEPAGAPIMGSVMNRDAGYTQMALQNRVTVRKWSFDRKFCHSLARLSVR